MTDFVVIENASIEKSGVSIEDGTIFTGKIGDYTDQLFLKFGDHILSLDRFGKGAKSCTGAGVWNDNATVKNFAPVKNLRVSI